MSNQEQTYKYLSLSVKGVMLWCCLAMQVRSCPTDGGKQFDPLLIRSMQASCPITSHLFGDDMVKIMRDLKQETSVIKEATSVQRQSSAVALCHRKATGREKRATTKQTCSTWGRQGQQKELTCPSTETGVSQCTFEQFVAKMYQQAHVDCESCWSNKGL